MRSKVDHNHAIVVGKVARAKAWPANGKAFSNGSVTIISEEKTIPISVGFNVKPKDETSHFNEVFKQGNCVALPKCQFDAWKKDEKETFQLKAKLNACYVLSEKNEKTLCTVSGRIVETREHWAMIESAYFAGGEGGRTGKLDHKRIRVLRPEGYTHERGHIVAIGTLEVSEKGPYVKADTVLYQE